MKVLVLLEKRSKGKRQNEIIRKGRDNWGARSQRDGIKATALNPLSLRLQGRRQGRMAVGVGLPAGSKMEVDSVSTR